MPLSTGVTDKYQNKTLYIVLKRTKNVSIHSYRTTVHNKVDYISVKLAIWSFGWYARMISFCLNSL